MDRGDFVSTRNINVNRYEDEYVVFGKALPYLAMLIGGALAFVLAFITRLAVWAQYTFNEVSAKESSQMLTVIICISMVILTVLAWKLFRPRDQVHYYVSWHAAVTCVLVHGWLLMAVWQDMGEWMFGVPTISTYFYGGAVVGLSWCIRRWAYRGDEQAASEGNVFEAIGLGEGTHIDGRNSRKIDSGAKYRLKLALGKTIEMAKDKREMLAQIANKPISQVHVSELPNRVAGQVDVTILDDDPFKAKNYWQGPDFPGGSIVEPITYATYDTGERPTLYIAGKDGGSSQHFLTMGMPGTGKSKAWQAIYGTVLNRREVSVIYGDPAKGMQTGGPLAAGLEWFATTEAECLQQIEAIERAIPVRTDYLTSKGLDHWVRGCGLNFVIFHLEEAARFAKVDDLIELVEAARSAGISIVISLQRATNDRLKTSARYNLGGNMCFGVKMKRDAAFGLSEYAIESGATPHLWQDRFPGRHYLEAHGLDVRMAGHPLVTDWIDIKRLEDEVDNGEDIRDSLDNVTADALGQAYQSYRIKVAEGSTNWQEMRRNRGHDGNTWDTKIMTVAEEELPFNVTVNETEDKVTATVEMPAKRRFGGSIPKEEIEQVRQEVWAIINDFETNGKHSFISADIMVGFKSRSKAWVDAELKKWHEQGLLNRNTETKFYSINRNTEVVAEEEQKLF